MKVADGEVQVGDKVFDVTTKTFEEKVVAGERGAWVIVDSPKAKGQLRCWPDLYCSRAAVVDAKIRLVKKAIATAKGRVKKWSTELKQLEAMQTVNRALQTPTQENQ